MKLSFRSVTFNLAADVLVERPEKKRNVRYFKLHRLKILLAYFEKIGSLGMTKGLEMKLTYSW